MTSFTKQLRTGTGAFARENLDNADLPVVPAEQVDAVLAEPVVDEVVTEVAAPAEQIVDGVDAVADVEADATTLEQTATILEDAVTAEADAAPVEDVEPAAVEIANITVESISNKYGIGRTHRVSRESFADGAARVATYRAVAREADDASKTLRERAVEGLRRLIEWIKNFVKALFSKRERLQQRIAALQTKAASIKGEVEAGAKIKRAGQGAVVGDAVSTDPLEGLKALVAFVNGLDVVAKMAKTGVAETGDVAETDLNPKQLGGLTLKISAAAGKYSLTREVGGNTEAKEIAPLTPAQIKEALAAANLGLRALKANEAGLEYVIKDMEGALGKIKSLATGKDAGSDVKSDRAVIMARYQAISKAAASISSTALSVLVAGLGDVEHSLAAYKEPKAA